MLVMVLPSHAGDGVVRATWLLHDVDAESCLQRRYRGGLDTMQCRCRVMLATMLLSHATNDATRAT
jgi:hypothetical protein